jgi:RHS repeat-associated protein
LKMHCSVTRTAISGYTGYPTDNTTNPNAFVARLNAVNGQKIGPSLVLRVMAGDTVQINSTAVYRSTAANTSSTTSSNMVTAILNAFSGSAVMDGIHDAGGVGSIINSGLTSGIYDGLKQKDPNQNLSNKPKAYLNFALFDDQFGLVDDNSGVRQVQGDPNVLQPLSVSKMTVKKTGFLYIYDSNESGDDVLFDNLVVTHYSGPVIEETHYYPFGLTMAGISAKALKGANYEENKLKYNGIELQHQEFADGSGLEWYGSDFRSLDAQTGRWLQIDPRPNYRLSPYASMDLNPVKYTDALGDTTVPVNVTPIQLKPVTITANGNPPISNGWMTFPLNLPLTKVPQIPRGITLPPIVIPAPHPILLTILLVALPANLNDPSSDHPPGPAFPSAKDLPWEPGQSPGPEWIWKGRGTPESGMGQWVNPNGQSLHPDLNHPLPKGPHWGLHQPDGSRWDIDKDGKVTRNKRD